MSSPVMYGNLVISPPLGTVKIGILDILLIVAMAEQWRRRTGSIVMAEVPGLIGFVFALLFEFLTSYKDLQLIPFITTGWIIGEALDRLTKR